MRDIENRKAYQRAYYQRNKGKQNVKSRLYYHNHREAILAQVKEHALRNAENKRIYARDRRNSEKLAVLKHYGGGQIACVICGESRLPCLSIDHINSGGTKHREVINRKGSGFYSWLKKQNFPEGYQTLCMNCQFVKRIGNQELAKRGDSRQGRLALATETGITMEGS